MESSKEGKHCYVNSLALSASNLDLKVSWSSPTLLGYNGNCTGPSQIQEESKTQAGNFDQVNGGVGELEKRDDGARKRSCYEVFNGAADQIPQSFYNWLIVFPCLALGVWAVIFSILGPDEACAGGSWLCLLTLIASAIVLGKCRRVCLRNEQCMQ